MPELYGTPLAAGFIWIGDKVNEILDEVVAELGTPPDGLAQIRAEWDRQRQIVPNPNLVIVSAWYPPVDIPAGRVSVEIVPAGTGAAPRSDA